jgi:DNA invertase Pin-like site-specific DNA recombinase
MPETMIGYARCSTDEQDLTAQQQRLTELGVSPERIYLDHELTGTNRARPGLDQALAAVRAGDTLVVPKLDRLARSVPDAPCDRRRPRRSQQTLPRRAGLRPTNPWARCSSTSSPPSPNSRSTCCACAPAKAWAVARAKGKLRGKQPKLSPKQQRELVRMAGTGEYTIADLAELFTVSRTTIYRTLQRAAGDTQDSR